MSLTRGRVKNMIIKTLDTADFERVYEIMENSFPPDERRTKDGQRALLGNDKYRILVCIEKSEILGFMAIWDFGEVAFLEHFAVDVAFRGKKIGENMLREALTSLQKPLFLEVEPPCDEITNRRVAFYKRNGLFLNEYDYMQPAMASGREAVPLMIMTSGGAINRAQFEQMRDLLYTYVYDLSLPENESIKKLVHP